MIALKSWIPEDETKLKPKCESHWSMHPIFSSGLIAFCVGTLVFFGSGSRIESKMFGFVMLMVGCAAIIAKELLQVTGLLEKLDERKTD